MRTAPVLGLVFVILAVIFFSLSIRDYLKAEERLHVARKAWMRIAVIFAGVGIGLFVMQVFLG